MRYSIILVVQIIFFTILLYTCYHPPVEIINPEDSCQLDSSRLQGNYRLTAVLNKITEDNIIPTAADPPVSIYFTTIPIAEAPGRFFVQGSCLNDFQGQYVFEPKQKMYLTMFQLTLVDSNGNFWDAALHLMRKVNRYTVSNCKLELHSEEFIFYLSLRP